MAMSKIAEDWSHPCWKVQRWPLSLASLRGRDLSEAPYIGLQRLRHADRSVGLLVVLENGDQSPSHRDARAVQRVHEAGLLFALRPVARVHAPGLEVAAIGAGRNLAIGLLPRQPHLDVVGLLRGETHVAGREHDDAIGKAETLQDLLRTCRHALVLLRRLLRRRDRDELDFGELMLADHAARVLAGGARFGAEARRAGGDSDG